MSLENTILKAFEKYSSELNNVWPGAEQIRGGMTAYYEDVPCEVLYCLARHFKPEFVFEMSPHHGWSTYFLISALQKNNNCKKVYSYDLYDMLKIPEDMKTLIDFKKGDARETLSQDVIQKCSFFFIDSEHDSVEFANWYKENILKNIPVDSMVIIDDMFHGQGSAETSVIKPYIADNKISHTTFAEHCNPTGRNRLMSLRNNIQHGIGTNYFSSMYFQQP